MAQDQLNKYKLELCHKTGIQTFTLNNNRKLKLYFSSVYKENVLAFCLSSSKHFIFTRRTWKLLKDLIPIVDSFLSNNNYFIQFQHPFTAIIAGPTGCGKTEFIVKLIEKQNELIVPSPTKIYYCYSIWQEKFNLFRNKIPHIVFNEGLVDVGEISENDNNLIIMDDLMREATENNNVMDIFTKGSHQKILALFL